MSDLGAVMSKPEHVAQEAIYDFDMFLDAELLRDPHARVQEIMREAPPVFWTPRNGGHWVIAGYKETYDASRDTATFSNELQSPAELQALERAMPAGFGHIPQAKPINMDPPLHTFHRAPLQAAFSPKAMMARREEIRALADSLIDRVADQGHCDFIADIGEPLPVQVFLKMLGLPLERLAHFRELVHEFLAPPVSVEDYAQRSRKVGDAMKQEIADRREAPQDDLLSLLWQAEVEGEPMTVELMEDFGSMLFIAGLDTVINGMGFAIRHLAMNPDLQESLRADPKLIVEASEEMLRRYTFTVPMRRVARDAQFAGVSLKEGERAVLFLPGADLDPREFAQPGEFQLSRENNVHIAFGVGPHRCLGSHLARIELQVLYEQMLARLPLFRLDPDRPVRFHAGNIIAVDSLPLRWD